MSKIWDDSMRALVRASPQAFVDLVLPDARYVGEFPHKLKHWQLEVDALLEVMVDEQKMLLHLEFQTYNDADMPERMLRYNVLARSEYHIPVCSCVIYLLKDGPIQTSPLRWGLPTGAHVLEFAYTHIEIGALSQADILATKQVGLLPFIPLTRDGATRASVQQVLTTLESTHNRDLELVGFALASMVLKRTNPLDWDWLQRRFERMQDILRDTPIFQQIFAEGLNEGRNEGRMKGLTEGLSEGRKEGLSEGQMKGILIARRETLARIVRRRFPQLQAVAEEQALRVTDPELLDDVIVELSDLRDEQEAAYLLRSLEQKA